MHLFLFIAVAFCCATNYVASNEDPIDPVPAVRKFVDEDLSKILSWLKCGEKNNGSKAAEEYCGMVQRVTAKLAAVLEEKNSNWTEEQIRQALADAYQTISEHDLGGGGEIALEKKFERLSAERREKIRKSVDQWVQSNIKGKGKKGNNVKKAKRVFKEHLDSLAAKRDQLLPSENKNIGTSQKNKAREGQGKKAAGGVATARQLEEESEEVLAVNYEFMLVVEKFLDFTQQQQKCSVPRQRNKRSQPFWPVSLKNSAAVSSPQTREKRATTGEVKEVNILELLFMMGPLLVLKTLFFVLIIAPLYSLQVVGGLLVYALERTVYCGTCRCLCNCGGRVRIKPILKFRKIFTTSWFSCLFPFYGKSAIPDEYKVPKRQRSFCCCF